jgi:phosphoribosylglycinamide formyltransferase 2
VEFFVRGDEVIFSEVSPRPHDTGLVTLISQDLSEFALHARAILGLPVPEIHLFAPAASCAVLVEGEGTAPTYHGIADALAETGTMLRIFGKPEVRGRRRMAVTLARGATVEEALDKAKRAASRIRVEL